MFFACHFPTLISCYPKLPLKLFASSNKSGITKISASRSARSIYDEDAPSTHLLLFEWLAIPRLLGDFRSLQADKDCCLEYQDL